MDKLGPDHKHPFRNITELSWAQINREVCVWLEQGHPPLLHMYTCLIGLFFVASCILPWTAVVVVLLGR